MPTRTRCWDAEMSKIVSNSEIHLHHCLCESRGFKTGKSNHRRCLVKKVFLKILQKWQKRTCVRVWHGFSTVSFTKFLRTLFLQNAFGRLLLMKTLMVKNFNSVVFPEENICWNNWRIKFRIMFEKRESCVTVCVGHLGVHYM